MADFKTGNDFRKGTVLRKINEDPTYLSFFFMFDTQDKEHSPLLAGGAKDYLENVVRDDIAKPYIQNLDNFNRLLLKINKDMPWFWQNLSGLENAMMFRDMQEPWWGAEKPALEIECLEENIELTAIALMDFYKRACYDFTRWVEVIPRNLREFTMWVVVSEVRAIQQNTNARNLGINDNPDSPGVNSSGVTSDGTKAINGPMSLEARPFIKLKFTHCEFDIDSIANSFADLSKNPELRKPKINIKWGTVSQVDQQFGETVSGTDGEDKFTDRQGQLPDYSTSPFDPRQRVQDKIGDLASGVKDAAAARLNNIKDQFGMNDSGRLGNAYGSNLGQLANNLIDGAQDAVLANLFLGNVHGASELGSFQDAIRAGSINGIGNLVTDMFGSTGNNPRPQVDKREKVYPDRLPENDFLGKENIHPVGVDSSPDGNITPKRVYDDQSPDIDNPINENVHE